MTEPIVDSCPVKHFLVIAFLTLLVQFGLTAISFPITELFTEKPLFYSDAGYHWYQMKSAVNLAQSGRLIGYDPYFDAGYRGGITYDTSARGVMFAGILLHRWLDEIVVYKLVVFLAATLGPFCLALALWRLGFSPGLIALGTLLGLLLWWTSVFRWYYTAGMTSFVLGSYLALPYLAYVLHYIRGNRSGALLVTLSISAALGFLYHPLFPVPVAVVTLAGLVAFRRSLNWKTLLGLTTIAFVAIAANLFWLKPVMQYHIFKDFRGSYQSIVDINMVWQEALGRWSGHAEGSKEYGLLIILTLWAWFGAKKGNEVRLIRSFSVSAVFLILFAAVGATSAAVAAQFQPNRFAPTGYLLLIIPATYGFREFSGALRRNWQFVTLVRGLAVLTAIVVGLGGVYLLNETRREVSFHKIPHYGLQPPEVKPLGEYSNWVIDWLNKETNKSARVLFETSKARIYDGSRMAGYYAYTSDREFIGGPYPYMYFAGFWDGWVFDKPIATIKYENLTKYLDLYNVGWVLVHSGESKNYFDSYSEAIPVASFKELKAYRLKGDRNYFVEGKGRVAERKHNEIFLSDLSGDSVIVKYHFVSGITSNPLSQIESVKLMDDPTPFVKIVNPPKEIQLFLP